MIVEAVTRREPTGDHDVFDVVFSEAGHMVKKTVRGGFTYKHDYLRSHFKQMALEAWRDLQWMQGKEFS